MRADSIVEPILATAALDFTVVYRQWFGPVTTWLRALGTPPSEIEDVAQEVFLVVRRKLGDFDGRNVPGWLYCIAAQTASDHRRRAWFRRLFLRAPVSVLEKLAVDAPDPLQSCEASQAQAELHALLARLKEAHRVAFWLFEIEGYTIQEAAALLGVSEAAVSMRIHYARKHLYRLVEKKRKEQS